MAPPAQQAEQVELSPYSKLEKTILRRATSVEINGQHCNLSGTSTSTTRHKQSRVIKYHLLDNPFLAVPVNHQDKGQRQAKPKAPDPGGAEETEGTQKVRVTMSDSLSITAATIAGQTNDVDQIQRQNPSSAPPEFHSTFQSFQTSSAPRPLWSSLTMPQNNGEGPVGSPRERSMFQVLEDARGLTGAEEGRVDIVPETPTQQGRATFRGPAAGWRSGTIHVGPAASPGSHDPFYNTPAPQTYGLGLNFGGTPNMFSPPGTAFGNPIPTPYNQNTFQWPNTPAPSRAMTSNNWRSPAPAPTSQEVQLHTPAPSLTHYSSYLGSQYYTLQVQGTLMSMYQPRPVNQTVTLYNPVASLVNTGLYQPRRGRSPEAYRTHNHINYYGYVPSSLHRNSDPTLADVRRAFRLHPRYHTIPQEKARAEKNHPTVITESEIDDEKTYGKWNGGYVEISDDLIARCICPADLLQHPCPWDELGDGCQMVRLCYVSLSKTLRRSRPTSHRKSRSIPITCARMLRCEPQTPTPTSRNSQSAHTYTGKSIRTVVTSSVARDARSSWTRTTIALAVMTSNTLERSLVAVSKITSFRPCTLVPPVL